MLDEIVLAWQAVKVSDGSTEASSFLSAASVTVMVFDVFGKLLQGFQADMRKNIEMVRQHVEGEMSLEPGFEGGGVAKAARLPYKPSCCILTHMRARNKPSRILVACEAFMQTVPLKEKLIDDEAKAAGSHAKALREGNASMGLLWLPGSTSGMFSIIVVQYIYCCHY